MEKKEYNINDVFYKTIDKSGYLILRDGKSFVFGENDQLLKKTTKPKSLRKQYEIINNEKVPSNKTVIEEDGKLVIVDKQKKSKNAVVNNPSSLVQMMSPKV